MEATNVTFASDDETSLKHTKVFLNKNLFQCYHHNRGYCSFGDRCRYQHFSEVCAKNICREKECEKRHPVICRYKDDCKFFKSNNCAFKHIDMNRDVVRRDIENKIRSSTDEIKRLEREITALKNDISIKEKELLDSRMEIKLLNTKLSVKLDNQEEKYIKNENIDLKKQIEILENENKALKIQIKQHDQINVESSVMKHQDIDNIQRKTNYSCEKCGLNFLSKEACNKHKSDMHKVKLTF